MSTTRRPLVLAARIWPALLALALTACGSTPPPMLLSLPLPPTAPAVAPVLVKAQVAASAASAASAPRFLTVRRINIPEYLQTDAVRYRLADSTLAEWPGTAWAERLEVGLTNHLALLLRQALPGWTVCDANCPSVPQGLVLLVNIAPFDYLRPTGALRADVNWRITGPGSAPTPWATGGGSSTMPLKSDSAVGQAEAMADVLGTLSQDISQALR